MYFKKTVTTYSGELVYDNDKNWGMHMSGCHLSDKVLMAFLHPGLPHVSRWPLPVRSSCLFELHYLGTCLLDQSVCHALYCFLDVFPMSTPNPSTPPPPLSYTVPFLSSAWQDMAAVRARTVLLGLQSAISDNEPWLPKVTSPGIPMRRNVGKRLLMSDEILQMRECTLREMWGFIFNSMPIRDGVITKIRRFVSISKTWSQSVYSLVTPDKDESIRTVLTVYIMRFIARCLHIHSGYVVGLHKQLKKTKNTGLCEDNANKNIKMKKSAFLLFSLSSIFSFMKRAIVFLHFLYSSYLEILLLMFYILISLIKQNIMLSKTVKEAVNILYTSIPLLLTASIGSCFPRMQIFLFCRTGML